MIKISNQRIENIKADIIVNAADAYIWFGSGVDGALRQGGGWDYIRECQKTTKKYAPIKEGDVALMKNKGFLKARYIIHASSPNLYSKNYRGLLLRIIRKIIRIAKEKEVKTVALPLLGSGAFGISRIVSKKIIINTIKKYGAKKTEYIVSIIDKLRRN